MMVMAPGVRPAALSLMTPQQMPQQMPQKWDYNLESSETPRTESTVEESGEVEEAEDTASSQDAAAGARWPVGAMRTGCHIEMSQMAAEGGLERWAAVAGFE